jgi:predicted ATPase
MLDDEAIRLLTVTGPAGVGKTRVAYAVAERLERDRSARVVRVDLAPLGDPALVADAIAAAAGAVDRTRRQSALEAAATAIGDAPARLVLGNFELSRLPPATSRRSWRHVLGSGRSSRAATSSG